MRYLTGQAAKMLEGILKRQIQWQQLGTCRVGSRLKIGFVVLVRTYILFDSWQSVADHFLRALLFLFPPPSFRIRRGDNGKCPVKVSDLVWIHNNFLAALAQANIGEDFDFWSYVPELEDSYLKFFKAYKKLKKYCSNVLAHSRILPVDKEAPTTQP